MYAGVGFEKRESFVVPHIWTVENKHCYWPKRINSKFDLMVIECVPPKSSWVLHKLKKILFTCDSYKEAQTRLDECIKLSTDSSGGTQDALIKNALPEVVIWNSPAHTDTETIHSTSSRTNTPLGSGISSGLSRSTRTSSIFEENIIRRLSSIEEEVQQQSMMTHQILRLLSQNETANILRPKNLPQFPIKKKANFKLLENVIAEPAAKNYLKQRLAALGGVSVRNATNNMLKFLLSNKLAKRFNWAGNNGKESFKVTKCAEVIRCYKIERLASFCKIPEETKQCSSKDAENVCDLSRKDKTDDDIERVYSPCDDSDANKDYQPSSSSNQSVEEENIPKKEGLCILSRLLRPEYENVEKSNNQEVENIEDNDNYETSNLTKV
ncbi:hypothetical protein RN001_005786 [Aquatica leii]|uniref:DUF4806 domain-containing protein n=1 Tax=Aquatica leii TaxID=1421715 RepID=A0AAN7SI51_9COLE|nr:hypothetical protein RN001_005786 [Aquatica leii]